MKTRYYLFTYALFLIVCCLLFFPWASAQVTFQKTYGGTSAALGYSVEQTTDGGYVIAGITNSFVPGGNNVYLVKINANGDTLWSKIFRGTSSDLCRSVRQNADGGFIITAYTTSFGAGNYDAYLIRTDANGDTLWTKTVGSAGEETTYSGEQTADGGFIFTGSYKVFNGNTYLAYLIRTDANGDTLWTKTFSVIDGDGAQSVQQTADGGYIISGSTWDTISANVYLIKTDGNGNPVWSKAYGGPGIEVGYFVRQTADGGYIITGYTDGFGAGDRDVYLIRTDANGDTLWTRTFGGTGIEEGNTVQQTADGGFIITGSTNSFGAGDMDVYLIRTDASGDTLWTKTFGGTDGDWGSSGQQTADVGYIITGFTENFGAGYTDVYLIKTDSLGNSGCNTGNTATIVTAPATQVTSPVTIVTYPPTIVTSPNDIVGSGCISSALCSTVGIHPVIPVLQRGISIFPDPSPGNFTITFPGAIITGEVQILDAYGEKVFSQNIYHTSKAEIYLENIAGGIYFVKVWNGEKCFTNKIMIQQN